MPYLRVTILVYIFLLCSCQEKPKTQTRDNYLKQTIYIDKLPKKENFWIFILAGQSNMEGYGLISPEDTIPSQRVLSLNKDHKWILAKEPLHFNQPTKGLDCGLSFGKQLANHLPDSIFIGLLPCAVGGSRVEEWLSNTEHRNILLYTNFETLAQEGEKSGIIRGILWHQGESNANPIGIKSYQYNLENLFNKFRSTLHNDSLIIITGELGSYLEQKKEYGPFPDSINFILGQVSNNLPNTYLISTKDLSHKGDTVHFDSPSLRKLGIRYAEKFLEISHSAPN